MTEASVQDPPVPTVSGAQVTNYWGTDETSRYVLPDGKQWIEFKLMNEGMKSQFQKLTNQDLTIGRDNTAKVRMDAAEERHTLIKQSVTDWYLFAPDQNRGGEMGEAAFSKQMLDKWLTVGPPKIIEELEMAIRKANPWMQAEMTVEAVEKEIDRLTEVRKELIEKAAGEATSANKS